MIDDNLFYLLFKILDSSKTLNPEMLGDVSERYGNAYGESKVKELKKMVQLAIRENITEDDIEYDDLRRRFIELKNKKGGYKRRSNLRKKRSRKKRSRKKFSRKKLSRKIRSRKKRSRKKLSRN